MPMKFVCTQCGYESAKWLGRCPSCGEWNTFREMKSTEKSKTWVSPTLKSSPVQIRKVKELVSKEQRRHESGLSEWDRVLGGGLVAGSLVLMGGDPGIGKSTLALQIASRIAQKGVSVLYASGEESVDQILARAQRLQIETEHLWIVSLSAISDILEVAKDLHPAVLFVDSIQTVIREENPSPPGSVSQVRDCGVTFLQFAKQTQTTVVMIGHVTKDGTLAGPRTLEHMVDVVLYLEGHPTGLRILRATKNRFGSVDEVGLFEMSERGLQEIQDPSGLFLVQRKKPQPGVVVIPVMEGIRPLLLEVEALVAHTPFSMPQRNVTGFEMRRLAMILALIENRVGVSLRAYDVFVNVTRGMRITESAADLGVALAILSSYFKKPLPTKTVVLGELGLTGEVRPIREMKRRLTEAKRLGFRKVILPAGVDLNAQKGIEVIPVSTIQEAVESCFS